MDVQPNITYIERSAQAHWPTFRQAGLALAGCALGAVVGAGVGVEQPTHARIGGLNATIDLNLGASSSSIKVGEGFRIMAPQTTKIGPQRVGADIVFDVSKLTYLKDGNKFNFDDLYNLMTPFYDYNRNIVEAKSAIVNHIIDWGEAGAGLVLATELSIFGAASVRRRNLANRPQSERAAITSYQSACHDQYRRVASLVAVFMASSLCATSQTTAAAVEVLHPNSVFDGTVLEGTEVSGLEASFAIPLLQRLKDINLSYDKVHDAVSTELDSVYGGPVPQIKDHEYILMYSSRRCNIGLDRTINELSYRYRAKTIISAGNDALGGELPVQIACNFSLKTEVQSDGRTIVLVPGDTDNEKTLDWEYGRNIAILRSDIKNVNGINVLGMADPRKTDLFQSTLPPGAEAQTVVLNGQADKAADMACHSKKQVDIAVLPDPATARRMLSTACGKITLAVSGHSELADTTATIINNPDGSQSYYFGTGSIGGQPLTIAKPESRQDKMTLGDLQNPANFTVISRSTINGSINWANSKNITIFPAAPGEKPLVTVTTIATKIESSLPRTLVSNTK